MEMRNMRWRFLLPGLIFPMTVATWLRFSLSVRVFDDSPVPWAWYGGWLSSWLNFPAFIYSKLAIPLASLAGLHGFAVGRLWLDPQILAFFPIVIVFWYLIGKNFDEWTAPKVMGDSNRKLRAIVLTLYGIGACFWTLMAIALVYEIAVWLHISSWYYLLHSGALELQHSAQFLWCVILAVHYAQRFRLKLRFRPEA